MRASGNREVACRLLLAGLALACSAASSGCMYFRRNLADAGVHLEHANLNDPHVAAYVSLDGKRMSISYRIVTSGMQDVHEERWLNIDQEMVAKALYHLAPQDNRRHRRFLHDERTVHRLEPEPRSEMHPAWDSSSMKSLRVIGLSDDSAPRDESYLGVRTLVGGYSLYFVATPPDSTEPTLICCPLPTRRYRTGGGYVALAAMPFAFVLDVITSPVQLVLDTAGEGFGPR
jgi:hypothetical protein